MSNEFHVFGRGCRDESLAGVSDLIFKQPPRAEPETCFDCGASEHIGSKKKRRSNSMLFYPNRGGFLSRFQNKRCFQSITVVFKLQ